MVLLFRLRGGPETALVSLYQPSTAREAVSWPGGCWLLPLMGRAHKGSLCVPCHMPTTPGSSALGLGPAPGTLKGTGGPSTFSLQLGVGRLSQQAHQVLKPLCCMFGMFDPCSFVLSGKSLWPVTLSYPCCPPSMCHMGVRCLRCSIRQPAGEGTPLLPSIAALRRSVPRPVSGREHACGCMQQGVTEAPFPPLCSCSDCDLCPCCLLESHPPLPLTPHQRSLDNQLPIL